MFVFPIHLFNPGDVKADVIGRTITGGEALNGEEDVIATDGGGRWEIYFSKINLNTPDKIRIWDAWQGYLAAGVVECLVPILSLVTAPRPAQGRGFARPSNILADDPVFPTSVTFASPYIIATAGAGALRATSIELTVTQGATLKGGEKFSIGGHAYKVIRETAPGIFQITPPLREAVTLGASVEFGWPLVKCRQTPGNSFSPTLSMSKFGEAEISFVEVP